MNHDLHQTLRGAAPRPSARTPFERLWTRGRRRRAAMRGGGAIAAIAVIGRTVTVLPDALLGDSDPVGLEVTDQPAATCPVTDATSEPFTPPAPYPPTPANPDAAWYGTPDLWTVITDTPGGQKSVWWSIHFEGGATEPRPDIEVRYQRLDDPDHEPIVQPPPGTNAHTGEDGWFMINGLQPRWKLPGRLGSVSPSGGDLVVLDPELGASVVDVATGATLQTLPVEQAVQAMQLGPWVAVTTPTEIVVHDQSTGEELFRRDFETGTPPEGLDPPALQSRIAAVAVDEQVIVAWTDHESSVIELATYTSEGRLEQTMSVEGPERSFGLQFHHGIGGATSCS